MLPSVRYITVRVVARLFRQINAGEAFAISLTPYNSLGPASIASTGTLSDPTTANFWNAGGASFSGFYYPTAQANFDVGHMLPVGGRDIRVASGIGGVGEHVLAQPAFGKMSIVTTTSSLGSYITASAGANEYPLVLGSNTLSSITGLQNGAPQVDTGEGDRAIVWQPPILSTNPAASFNDVFSQLRTEHRQGTDSVYHHVPLAVNQGARWIDVDALQGQAAENGVAPLFPGYSNGWPTSGLFQGQGVFMVSAVSEVTSLTIEADITYHVLIASPASPFNYLANSSTASTPVPHTFGSAGSGDTMKSAVQNSLVRAATHPTTTPDQVRAVALASKGVGSVGATYSDSSILPTNATHAQPHEGPTTTERVANDLGWVATAAQLWQNRSTIASGASRAWGMFSSGANYVARGAARLAAPAMRLGSRALPAITEGGEVLAIL